MREIIWLEEGDDASIVRYKLEHARSRRVALVIPPGSTLLQSEVGLILVRRFADALALDLVLVARDRAAVELARRVGLRTVASEGAAQRVRGRGPKDMLTRLQEVVPAAATRLPTLPIRRQTERGLRGLLGLQLGHIILLTMGCAVTFLSLAALMVLVPRATIVLDPKGSRETAHAELVARTDVERADSERGWVPARIVEIEAVGEEDGQTTGKQSIPDQHATGEVVFANKTMESATVPKGTVVRTNDGEPVRFYTLLDVDVPGSYGATARVPVMAFEPGPAGNVAALTIRVVEGEAAYKVDVLNDQPTRGGADKRVSIVSSEDHDRLRALLMQRLQQKAYGLLVQKLDPGEWIPPDTIEVAIAEEVFDQKVGEPAEALRLTMKVRVGGVAVQGQATRELMIRRLESHGKGLVVNDATLQVEQPVGKALVEGQVVRFRARASAQLVRAIDLQTVSARLAGWDQRSALEWLSAESEYDLRQPPEIRIEPDWWPRLPWLPSRIKVQLSGEL